MVKPVAAGQMARQIPLSLHAVILLIALAAVLSQISNALLWSVNGAQMLEDFYPKVDATSSEFQTYRAIGDLYVFFYESPLLFAVIAFIIGGLQCLFLVKIGLRFAPHLRQDDLFSAVARWEIVKAALNLLAVIFSALFFVISQNAGTTAIALVQMVTLTLFVLNIFVLKGIFDCDSVWKAFGIYVGMLVCMFIAGIGISMILLVFL